MSKLAFQSKIILDSAYESGVSGDWVVTFTVDDGEGLFTGSSVRVGDYIVVDTGAFEPGTITLYEIVEITTPHFRSPTVTLRYHHSNNNAVPNPDLSYSLGQVALITRPSTNVGMVNIPSADAQQMSDRFSMYLTNYNLETLADPAIASGAGAEVLPNDDKLYAKVNNEWVDSGSVKDPVTGVIVTDLGVY
jgi:hypothetical protein